VDTPKEFDWRRSSRCETGNCVEVARINGEYVLRDTKQPDGPRLRFSNLEWHAFVEAVRAGEFG
jgi:hypothetical protein